MDEYLTRVACLGQWVINGVLDKKKLYNQQKVRVDQYIDLHNKTIEPTKENIVFPHLLRKDIKSLISQQEKLPWLSYQGKPKAIIMDSFAELTDQFFKHQKENWGFCSHYTDIKHTSVFKNTFENKNLLNLNLIHIKYNDFFKIMRFKYDCPIIFIHFPIKFEHRVEFKERYKIIYETISEYSKIYDISNFIADDNHIERMQNDNFAYHFSKKTVNNIVEKICKSGVF